MRRMYFILLALAILMAMGTLGCQNQGDTASHVEADAGQCQEHNMVEARCPFCNPDLIESMGQCPGHGVPEALCYQCSPSLIPAFKGVGDWCAGHDRPESQCYICNPGLNPNTKTASNEAQVPTLDNQHVVKEVPTPSNLPRSQTPPVVFCQTNELIVRLESPEVARDAGLELAVVERRPISKTLEFNAEVTYNKNRFAQLASQVPGVVVSVKGDLGDAVATGEILATVKSAQLAGAKSAYLQALAGVELWEIKYARESSLLEKDLLTEREVLETKTRLTEHRIELSNKEQELLSLGLSLEQINKIAESGDTSPLYKVTAPFRSVVVDRHAVVGEVVDSSHLLFAVADISQMWALLDVYDSDLRELRPGQAVVVRADGLPGDHFGGYITWVSAQMDPQTRTLRARAELDNSSGLLRAHMFARALVTVRDRHESVVVPQSAVQWEGCCNIVFVKKSDMDYQPRKVQLGSSMGSVYEVLSGVVPGEEIVTQGSFLLKTEILKGSIGAGCCEVQPGT